MSRGFFCQLQLSFTRVWNWFNLPSYCVLKSFTQYNREIWSDVNWIYSLWLRIKTQWNHNINSWCFNIKILSILHRFAIFLILFFFMIPLFGWIHFDTTIFYRKFYFYDMVSSLKCYMWYQTMLETLLIFLAFAWVFSMQEQFTWQYYIMAKNE